MSSETAIDEKLSQAFELFENNKLIEAEEIYQECLSVMDTSSSKYEAALHWLGYVKSELEKFNEARLIYFELREIAKSSLNLQDELIAIHQLGMVERMAANYDKAKELFDEELTLLRSGYPNLYVGFAANYYEQGYILFKKNNLIDAEKMMHESLRYAEQSSDQIALGCSLRGLGEINKVKGELKKAKSYFEQSILSFNEGHAIAAVNEVNRMIDEICD